MSDHRREGLRKHSCTGSHLEKDCGTILAKENMKETKRGVELKLSRFLLVDSKSCISPRPSAGNRAAISL